MSDAGVSTRPASPLLASAAQKAAREFTALTIDLPLEIQEQLWPGVTDRDGEFRDAIFPGWVAMEYGRKVKLYLDRRVAYLKGRIERMCPGRSRTRLVAQHDTLEAIGLLISDDEQARLRLVARVQHAGCDLDWRQLLGFFAGSVG